MENYKTISTSLYSAKLTDPVVIEETSTTRKVLLVELNDKKLSTGETVKITFVHQRKKNNDNWEDVHSLPLSSLKGGEGVKLSLDSKTTKRVFEELTRLYALIEQEGVQLGINEFTVTRADEIINIPKDRKLFIERLLSENYGEEVWEELIDSKPDLATKLSLARIQSNRQESLKIFKDNLSKNRNEQFWQEFFQNNTWIFGFGLNYQFLHLLTSQPNYGGVDYTGKGAQRGDFLMNSAAAASFTVLVEIKKPSSLLLSYEKENEPRFFRNGVVLLSSSLLGAVSQIQINSRTWVLTSQDKANNKLQFQNIFTVDPKSILIIGNTEELQNDEECVAFETFRKNLKNPEVITFDELYERAKFIVTTTI